MRIGGKAPDALAAGFAAGFGGAGRGAGRACEAAEEEAEEKEGWGTEAQKSVRFLPTLAWSRRKANSGSQPRMQRNCCTKG